MMIPVTIAAISTASSEPIRSPSRPITATWTAPNRPAVTARAAASPVESIAPDAIRSRLSRAEGGNHGSRHRRCTRRSPTPSGTPPPRGVRACRSSAAPSATARCSARRSGEPAPRVLRRVRVGRHGRVQGRGALARVRGDGRGRDGDGHPLHRALRRGLIVHRARPSEPRRPGRARLRDDRLREGAAARDDQAQPARRPQRVRLPDAARDRAGRGGRVVGRRDPRRRRHRRGPRLLRRRRPALVGGDARRQAAGVLEVVRRLQGHARPAARARQADDRARSTGSPSGAATSCRWRATSP